VAARSASSLPSRMMPHPGSYSGVGRPFSYVGGEYLWESHASTGRILHPRHRIWTVYSILR